MVFSTQWGLDNNHHTLPIISKPPNNLLITPKHNLLILHQRLIPNNILLPTNHTPQTLPANNLKLLHSPILLKPSTTNNRLSQRMLRQLLKRTSNLKQLLLRCTKVISDYRPTTTDCPFHCLRLPLSNRPSLIKNNNLYLLHSLNCLALPNQNSSLRPHPRTNHQRNRNSQPQRTRTRNNQNRNSNTNSPTNHSPKNKIPSQKSKQSQNQNNRNKNTRYFVSQFLNRHFRSLSFFNQLNNMRQKSITSYLHRLHMQNTILIQSRSNNQTLLCLINRQTLPRHHRLINRTLTPNNNPVSRNLLTRLNNHNIPNLNLTNINLNFLLISNNYSLLRPKLQQLLNLRSRPPLGLRLNKLPRNKNRHNHTRHPSETRNLHKETHKPSSISNQSPQGNQRIHRKLQLKKSTNP